MGLKERIEWREELVFHPGAQEGPGRIIILQGFLGDILQILGAQGRKHLFYPLMVTAGHHEVFDRAMVAPGADQHLGHVVAVSLFL